MQDYRYLIDSIIKNRKCLGQGHYKNNVFWDIFIFQNYSNYSVAFERISNFFYRINPIKSNQLYLFKCQQKMYSDVFEYLSKNANTKKNIYV